MGCSVSELLARFSSYELSEWMAFYKLSPFDDARQDLNFGIVSSVIANTSRTSDIPAYKPLDFMPDFAGEKDKNVLDDKIKNIFLGLKNG